MTVLRAARNSVWRSALVVPVPSAEPAVGAHRTRLDPSARLGMPAHVTLLYPFVPGAGIDGRTLRGLGRLFARHEPFRFALGRVASFPGVLYLAPEPADRFVALTRALVAAWPRYPPYDGAHADVVPHLTVAIDTWPGGLAADLAAQLPIECRADEAWLLTAGVTRRWSVRARFALGSHRRSGRTRDGRERGSGTLTR